MNGTANSFYPEVHAFTLTAENLSVQQLKIERSIALFKPGKIFQEKNPGIGDLGKWMSRALILSTEW